MKIGKTRAVAVYARPMARYLLPVVGLIAGIAICGLGVRWVLAHPGVSHARNPGGLVAALGAAMAIVCVLAIILRVTR